MVRLRTLSRNPIWSSGVKVKFYCIGHRDFITHMVFWKEQLIYSYFVIEIVYVYVYIYIYNSVLLKQLLLPFIQLFVTPSAICRIAFVEWCQSSRSGTLIRIILQFGKIRIKSLNKNNNNDTPEHVGPHNWFHLCLCVNFSYVYVFTCRIVLWESQPRLWNLFLAENFSKPYHWILMYGAGLQVCCSTFSSNAFHRLWIQK